MMRTTVPQPERPREEERSGAERDAIAGAAYHRTAFMLSPIDGRTNIRSLIDVTGLVADEVLAVVERLIELRAIATR